MTPYHKKPKAYTTDIWSKKLNRRVSFIMSDRKVEYIYLRGNEESDEEIILAEIKKHFRLLEDNWWEYIVRVADYILER